MSRGAALVALLALGLASAALAQESPPQSPPTPDALPPTPDTAAPPAGPAPAPEAPDAASSPERSTAPPSPAPAEVTPDANTMRARTLFQEGVALSRSERWAEALAVFRESAALVERPSTVLNIATALQRLGRARECVAAVDRYLAISDATADAEPRARATALRAAMVETLAHVALAILPPDAELAIDGVVTTRSETGELELDPGTHVFLVSRDGHLPARFTLELAPGARVSRAVALAARPADPAMLEVSTQVVGARIEVDGDVVGVDDVELELVPGPHTVRVTADGWQPFERALVIEAGTRARLDAQLSRPGSCQSVECEPAFWIVGGVLLAGAVAAAIALPFALATEGEPYGGTANFHVDALTF